MALLRSVVRRFVWMARFHNLVRRHRSGTAWRTSFGRRSWLRRHARRRWRRWRWRLLRWFLRLHFVVAASFLSVAICRHVEYDFDDGQHADVERKLHELKDGQQRHSKPQTKNSATVGQVLRELYSTNSLTYCHCATDNPRPTKNIKTRQNLLRYTRAARRLSTRSFVNLLPYSS